MRYYILHMLIGNRMIDIWRSNIQIAKIAICFSTSYYTSVQTQFMYGFSVIGFLVIGACRL